MSEALAVQQLFIYGNLMSYFDNPIAYVLERNCQMVGKGTIPGKLHFIQNDFPGAVFDENASSLVYGQIFSIDPESYQLVMRLLDRYHSFDEGNLSQSLFTKAVLEIQSEGYRVPCWTYLYNQSVDQLPQIESGNYWQFLKENNLHKKQ
ncbi:MAG: gamma-glutamylcyclotransferase family protein [Flammeovirgaceae bacterium]